MNIYTSVPYIRRFKKQVKKNRSIGNQVDKKIVLFLQDKNHPSLRLHKLSGQFENMWSISINDSIRILFHYVDDGIVLGDIGSHDEVYLKK